jgi:hypothetical protein
MISWLNPPEGFGCQHFAELGIFSIYLLSALLDIPMECTRSNRNNRPYGWAFAKDVLACVGYLAVILAVRWGNFNLCSCWTRFGAAGLAFPQDPEVISVLEQRSRGAFLTIITLCVVLQLVICSVASYMFWDAFRVFLQRDIGKPNLPWLRRRLNPLPWLTRGRNTLR